MQNTKRNMLSEQPDNLSRKHKTKEMSYNKVVGAILVGIIISVISSVIFASWVTPVDVEKKADKIELKAIEKDLNTKINAKVDKGDLENWLKVYDKKNELFLQKLDERINRMESRIDYFYTANRK
jgi:hypothetical protein